MAIRGFGSKTTGGQGGTTYTVTSGANSGPGTFRDYAERSGPRIIEFAPDVRSVHLTSMLRIFNGNLTILGQNAGGVQIRGRTTQFRDSNIWCEHLKFRGADYEDVGAQDVVQVGREGYVLNNFFFKHCEMAWATDECFAMIRSCRNGTIERCLVAEAFENINTPRKQARGLMFNGNFTGWPKFWSVLDSGLAMNFKRNILIADGDRIEFCNNFVYGPGDGDSAFSHWGPDHGGKGREGHPISPPGESFAGYNHYQYGPETEDSGRGPFAIEGDRIHYNIGNKLWDENGVELNTGAYDPLWRVSNSSRGPGVVHESVPSWASGAHGTDVDNVRQYVLALAGAYPSFRDSATLRIIDEMTNATGGLKEDLSEVGGYPVQVPFVPGSPFDPEAPDGSEGAGAGGSTGSSPSAPAGYSSTAFVSVDLVPAEFTWMEDDMFVDAKFPLGIMTSMSVVLEWETLIARMDSGFESRSSRHESPTRTWTIRTANNLRAKRILDSFAIALGGPFKSFRHCDPTDYSTSEYADDDATEPNAVAPTDQLIGVGDGSTVLFQLQRRNVIDNDGGSPATLSVISEVIDKPVEGTVRVAIDGVEILAGDSPGWSLDYSTGLLTFTAPPANGLNVTWGGHFDWHVRFENDVLSNQVQSTFEMEAGAVRLKQLKTPNA